MIKYNARAQPLQYPNCRDTVTLYHVTFNPFICRRTVVANVLLERRGSVTVDKEGSKPGSGVLLIIPQSSGLRVSPAADTGTEGCYVLQPGDRAMAGVGPEIANREDWSKLVPANYDVTTLTWVEQKHLRGEPCHVEAGCG